MPQNRQVQNGYCSSPEKPLDVLIVGGGPSGTATAFRAKELGLNALVIELDDLLKRIRDYAKDKPILPSHQGGAGQKFPAGGPLIALLPFDPIDKDEMCAKWKGFYREHQVPSLVGVELTALERAPDRTWIAKVWNQREHAEGWCYARHVVIAMGRGVPRRFDIPGNVEGIAFRLDDARNYVDEPICIVGGGTSAAEAVIAVSNAKIDVEDPTTVHWCYRGDKMPLVAKALADVLFDAAILNGNIRFHPHSEPTAITVGDDKQEYFSIRTDRRVIAGRPSETTHLEFPKNRCIACIGEEIPEKFLNSLGIQMVIGGPQNKKMMCVTPRLETVLENVYMVGDILSPAYLETEEFDEDPATFRVVERNGNVKMGLFNGVLVAEVIAEKLKGNPKPVVRVKEVASGDPSPASDGIGKLTREVQAEDQPQQSRASDRVSQGGLGRLVRMTTDQVATDEYPVKANGVTTIGRNGCDIDLPNDTMLSERHASISHGPQGCFLRDDGSETGVFLKVPEARWIDLDLPAIVRAGRQFLRFSENAGAFTLVHYDLKGRERGRHPIQHNVVLGRESPDLVLDPQDMTMSRSHLGVGVKDETVRIRDLGSMNGTFLKVESGARIQSGDEFRMGHERFVLKQAPGEPSELGTASQPAAPSELPVAKGDKQSAPQRAPSMPPSGAPSVTVRALGKTVPVQRHQSICEALEAHGIEIDTDCRRGACGRDPIRILEGAQHLNTCGDREAETLEFGRLEAGPCRLACMAKPKGPVVIEILKTT
jgi:thioredoxin reductase/ferredoxin/pSer/pThr/pTyr-binding forkhead associated (FHA) protein